MKEVIILGHGPTRMQCDYHCETWGVNNTYTFAPRLDRLYIFDPVTEWEFSFESLHKCKQLVLSYPNPIFAKNSIVYPIREILKYFNTMYFSNAICYMLAHALYEKYEKIWLFGIDMATRSTYLFERPGVDYWCGIAHAMGVPVIQPKESATCKTIDGKMYGYFGPEFENTSFYLKAVKEQMDMIVQSFKDGMKGVPVPDSFDPDGHEQKKMDGINMLTRRDGIA